MINNTKRSIQYFFLCFLLVTTSAWAIDLSDYTENELLSNNTPIGMAVSDIGKIYALNAENNSLYEINPFSGQTSVLLDELNTPLKIDYHRGKLYYIEAGTDENEYRDGKLSSYDIITGEVEAISNTLFYPKDLFVDLDGSIYLIEAGESNTSYTGNNRLLKFHDANQMTVLLNDIDRPTSIVVDNNGYIFLGLDEFQSNNDSLLKYNPQDLGSFEVILENLPSINGLDIDRSGNIYIATSASIGQEGLAVWNKGATDFSPLVSDTLLTCVALDNNENVYYASSPSIIKLTKININPKFNIVSLEYFIDHDPGFGQGTSITINEAESITKNCNIDISNLLPGFHRFYLRAKDETGNWGVVQSRPFYMHFPPDTDTPLNLSNLEYFVDQDPGFGQGIPITINESESFSQNCQIDTSSLAPGFHKLYFRAKNELDNWGIVQSRPLYLHFPPEIDAPVNLSKIEYFFGQGESSFINMEPDQTDMTATIPLDSVSPGFHRIYIRAHNENGVFGIVQSKPVYLHYPLESQPEPFKLSYVEYFFDEDPQVGNAQKINLIPQSEPQQLTINIMDLEKGFHRIYFRAFDENDNWGLVQSRPVYLHFLSNPPLERTIAGAEYFFNQDPGFGSGTFLDIAGQELETKEIDLHDIHPGFHRLYFRIQHNEGTWGIIQSRPVYLAMSDSGVQHNIQKLEYFFGNTDPGFGNATPIAPSVIAPSITIEPNIILAHLPTGEHTFRVRAKNDNGVWGIIQSESFQYTEISKPFLTVSPTIQKVNAKEGHTNFQIKNVGAGTLTWQALIQDGDAWASFENDYSGVGDATINIHYQQNDGVERTAIIVISAEDAINYTTIAVVIRQNNIEEIS